MSTLDPFYGSESAHLNTMASIAPLSTHQTIHGNGVPPLIAEDISPLLWSYAQRVHGATDALLLVHQKTITFNNVNYTVDYITTHQNGMWYQYKVVYHDQSPLPHTVDFRFETQQGLAVPPAVPSSSSTFRAAAWRS